MLRPVLLAVVVALLATVSAAPADAASLGGKKWKQRTITFHASAPQHNEAITAGSTRIISSRNRVPPSNSNMSANTRPAA